MNDPTTDYLVRAIGGGGNIRALVASTTVLVNEAARRHDTWPTTTAALGRALTATVLLSATLKDADESVTLRIAGDGPCGNITCDADEAGHVRGYVRNPHVDLPPKNGKLDVSGVVGGGYLHITRQLAIEGMYTGTSELVSGEIGDDLTHYLLQSEQTASAVGLGVRVAPDGAVVAAGGFLVQLLPETREAEMEQLEINVSALGAVSQAIEEGLTPEQIAGMLLAGIDYEILERRPVHFACRCSREKALGVLSSLGPDDLHEMIHEDGGAEMNCQFCGEVYRFTADELRGIHRDPS
ncbi:MAG TPA: Hsp33 family molecular chaperone HslO [Symbiobacteriaceae bacterium]